MTIPAISKRSSPTKAPRSSTWRFCGSTGGCGFGLSPNATSIDACSVSRTPSEAASFASGDAAWSGLKASSSIATPKATMTANVITSAGAVGMSGPKRPVRSAQ